MAAKKYPFVFVLLSLTSLVSTDKIQKKSSFRTRLVGLISTKTKEYFFGRHLCIRSIVELFSMSKFERLVGVKLTESHLRFVRV